MKLDRCYLDASKSLISCTRFQSLNNINHIIKIIIERFPEIFSLYTNLILFFCYVVTGLSPSSIKTSSSGVAKSLAASQFPIEKDLDRNGNGLSCKNFGG